MRIVRKTLPTRRRIGFGALGLALLVIAAAALGGAPQLRPALAAQGLPTLPPLPCPSLPPIPPTCPSPSLLPTPVPTLPPPPSLPTTTLPSLVPSLPGLPTPTSGLPGGLPPAEPGSGATPGTGTPGSAPGSTPSAPGSTVGPLTPVGALAATTPYVPIEVSGELVGWDPFLAWQVESVLQHPISQQRPDLAHFSLDGATTTAAASSSGPGGAAGAALLAGAAAIVLLLGGATLARVGRRSMALRAGVLLGMFIAAGPLAALAVSAAVTASQAPSATPVAEARPAALTVASAENVLRARALTTPAAQPAAPAPPQESPAWLSLVGIEQAIARDHDLLAQNESAIAAYNAMLPQAPAASAAPPAALPAAAAPAPPSVAPESLPDAPISLAAPAPAASAADAPAQSGSAPDQAQLLSAVTSKLTQLVAAHGPLAAAYAGDLQNEYDYFLAVVRSPDQQSEILHAAAQVNPAALTAVTYDIQTVYTQLAQESAISAAEVADASPQAGWAHWTPPSGPISFHAPVGGVVTQGFGPTPFTLEPPIRYDGVFYPHFHTGLDIAAPLGTPLGAAASGIVILATASRNAAGYFTGYGNYVVIEHGDGFVTLYGHLERLLVTTGQTVAQGQVIGLLGSTGWSTGPHVHFEVRDNGVFVDPAPYIASQLTR